MRTLNIALIAFPEQRPHGNHRAGKRRQYIKLKKVFLSENKVCAVCKFNAAIQVHHRRGNAGELLTLVSEFIAICQQCHTTVHQNPAWAIANGWLGTPWNHLPVDAHCVENFKSREP